MDKTPKVELILHPVRLRIIQALSGRTLTIPQLIKALPDLPPNFVELHMETLKENGMVKQIEDGSYGIVKGQDTLSDDELSAITPEQYIHYFNVFVTGLQQNFANYVNATGGMKDCEMYFDEYFYMSDEEYGEFMTQVLELFQKTQYTRHSAGKKRRKFAVVMHDDYSPEE